MTKKLKTNVHLTLTEEHAQFLRQMVDTTGLKNEQEVLTTFVNAIMAYEKRIKKISRKRKQPSIEAEVNELFDELSSDSAMLSELNGWTCYSHDPRTYLKEKKHGK